MQFKYFIVTGAATAGGLFNEQATFQFIARALTTIWVQLASKGIFLTGWLSDFRIDLKHQWQILGCPPVLMEILMDLLDTVFRSSIVCPCLARSFGQP